MYARVLTSADDTVTTTCMLDRPVCTMRARTSMRLPGGIGRRWRTLPTYAVTQYAPAQPTAHAYPALSIHSMTLPAATERPPAAVSAGVARNRRVTRSSGLLLTAPA